MAVKQVGQAGFADGWLGSGCGVNEQLARLDMLVKWYRFEKLVAHLRDASSAGRPGYPALVLVKALLLQAMYGLSDRELEEALADRLSFRRFVGLSLADGVPDHTVLGRFRGRLVSEGIEGRLFAELDRQLEKAGMMLKRGTMLDATLIPTVTAPPRDRGGCQRSALDPDAAFARREGRAGSVFGYKAHVGVDQGSGLIRTVVTTPANINDTTPADALVRGDEAAVYADKAYAKRARSAGLRAQGIKPRIMHKGWGGGPPLTFWQQRHNKLIAPIRAGVETTFATLKQRMGLSRIRYRGLAKASAQIVLAAIAFNLRRWARLAPA
jgi:transposase, IS5 family